MANSEKTAKKSPKAKKIVKMKKNIFEKIRNFSALDERDCQAAWLFAHWGQFGRETRAWPDGADPPHFHMHIGKIGQFFKIRVFPATRVGLGADSPHKTARHLPLPQTTIVNPQNRHYSPVNVC